MTKKKAYSGPQEIEEAEQKAEERREEQEEEAQEQEQEEQEESKQSSEEEQEEESQEQEEASEEEKMSSELDDILSDHSGVDEEEIIDEEQEESEESEEETSEYEPMDLEIDNDRFEEITTDPESFQEFITEVRKDAVAEARSEFQAQLNEEIANAKEEILRNIPEVVNKTAQRTQSVKQVRDQFFENNPGLKNKMGYVSDMTNRVSHQNPDWSAKQVLNEVAKRAQRDLDLSKQAEERERDRKKDPKFAGAGGRRNPGGSSDKRGKQEKIMDDTFK